jgi:phage terminase large subunit-like protein
MALALTEADLDLLGDAEVAAVRARYRWLREARSPRRKGKQIPPADADWQIVLFKAGRGFGKSRGMYEFAWWEAWRVPGIIGHCVAPTQSDLRSVTFEGPVGLCSLIPAECLKGGTLERAYNKTTHEIRLSNDSVIRGFGAVEEARRLRGPQCHFLTGDELREWDAPAGNLETAMNNALFGLRLPYPDGTPSRAVMGTTPKPIPFLKRFEKREGVRVVTGTSYENLDNLSASYRTQLMSLAGTQIGRQEIDALYIDEDSDLSILKRHWIKLWPNGKKLPDFSYILISMDTAFEEHNFNVKKQTTDPTACIVLGVFNIAQCFDADERKKLGLTTVPGRPRNGVLLCDAWSERLGFPDLLERARAQYRVKWGTPGKRADMMLIEAKSSGISLRQTLATYNVPTWPYNPGNQSKTMRAHAVSPLVAQSLFFVPESSREDRKGLPRDWCDEFLEEVCAFAGPGSTQHDDWVDTLTSGLLYLRDRDILTAMPNEKFVDLEMKLAEDREEAQELMERERSKKRGNPYG